MPEFSLLANASTLVIALVMTKATWLRRNKYLLPVPLKGIFSNI